MISTNGFFLIVIALPYIQLSGLLILSKDAVDSSRSDQRFASSALIKSRSPATAKLDYSHVTVELRTLDGLVKDQTQCAPNGYYFIPIYDKGSFVIKIKGPEGWSYAPEQVPVVVDHTGCNANEDINFRFTGFTLSGRVVGAVGGIAVRIKVVVHQMLMLNFCRDVVSSVLTSSTGSYLFKNIIPGKYNIRASHRDLNIEVKGSAEVELGFDNGVVDDILFVSGYDIRGLVVAQIGYDDVKDLDFVVFEQPDTTILSGHVEGKNIKDMHSHIRVEIRPASDPSTVESIFPLPISNFFQAKDLPKSKHLLQLRSALPSGNHRFVSEVFEIDLERQPQIHVGPLSFRIEEDMYKQELTPARVSPGCQTFSNSHVH